MEDEPTIKFNQKGNNTSRYMDRILENRMQCLIPSNPG